MSRFVHWLSLHVLSFRGEESFLGRISSTFSFPGVFLPCCVSIASWITLITAVIAHQASLSWKWQHVLISKAAFGAGCLWKQSGCAQVDPAQCRIPNSSLNSQLLSWHWQEVTAALLHMHEKGFSRPRRALWDPLHLHGPRSSVFGHLEQEFMSDYLSDIINSVLLWPQELSLLSGFCVTDVWLL